MMKRNIDSPGIGRVLMIVEVIDLDEDLEVSCIVGVNCYDL
jgi:hypothetical protein